MFTRSLPAALCGLFMTLLPADQGLLGQSDSKTSPKNPVIETEQPWQLGDPITFWDGKATVDFQIRERFEYRDNWIDFSDAADVRDDTALLQRIRLGLRLDPVEWLSIYAQGQDSRTFFDDPSDGFREFVTNDNPFQLHQANVTLKNPGGYPVFFKIGRQQLNYGDQRLVGAFEWDNNARVFDSLRLAYEWQDGRIEYFAGYPVFNRTEGFDNPNTHDLFMGLYLTTTNFVPMFDTDWYAFLRDKDKLTPSTVQAPGEQIDGATNPNGTYATLGTRWKSKKDAFGPWDFGGEFAFQVGNIVNPVGFGSVVGGVPINTGRQSLFAGAVHGEVGYTFDVVTSPRLNAQMNWASGDPDPSDGISHTFQNLFPTNHKFYGYMDRFSWQNMINPAVGISLKPMDRMKISLDYHLFWLATTNDPWRFAGQGAVGGPVRYANALTNSPSNFVGSEIDLVFKYDVTKWAKFEAGYSHFFAGPYIKDTSAPIGAPRTAHDADFVYVQLLLTF